MDEFDIEAVHVPSAEMVLDEQAAEGRRQTDPPASLPPLAPLGASPLPQRLTRRNRIGRVAGTGAALLLALTLLFGAVPGARNGIGGLLQSITPSPTPPIPNGGDVFFWENTVPWGGLRVDGQPGPNLDVAPKQDLASRQLVPPSFRLPRGRHTLQYIANLFPTRTCVVYVPDIERDTCAEPIELSGAVPPFVGPPARVLDLGDDVGALRPADLAALIAATEPVLEHLTAPATVAMGAAYLGASGRPLIASQPLTAGLSFTINRDPHSSEINFQDDCVSFCDVPAVNGLPVTEWPLTTHVVAHWRYALANGELVLDNAPGAPDPEDEQIGIVVEARWDGAWHVTLDDSGYGEPAPPPCLVGEAMFDRDSGDPALAPSAPAYHWLDLVSLPDQGCLIAGGQALTTTSELSGPVALIIYRFGLLEVANPLAMRIFPALPVATLADRALARQHAPSGTAP